MSARSLAAVLVLAAALSACRAKPVAPAAEPEVIFAPPAGKRAFSLSIDKSQTQFLAPGDAVEVVMLVETPRADGASESRSEVLSPRAEVLRVSQDWGESTGLVSLALTPEEAQFAALASDREDRLFLNKTASGVKLEAAVSPPKPELAPGSRGLAVLVYPDQLEFVEPGDRVDVIATRQGGKASGKSELTAVTLFQDVLVLGARAAEGSEEWSTVQLMLTADQAKTMTRSVAAEDGLLLTLRAPDDHATRPIEPAKMSRKIGASGDHPSPKS
jgi:Flp pilus assembly protein CpaB